MRSHRFYSANKMQLGEITQLPKDVSHHCIQVLRYRLNDELSLFNGDGNDYIAQVIQIDGKQASVKILEIIPVNNESPLTIHLYQGVARGEKMDLIIQKAVELGISQITPVFSERCNVKLDAKRQDKKQQHWKNVATSACEQSGRAMIPSVNEAINIKQAIRNEHSMLLFLEPTATTKIQAITLNVQKNISLFIGPEGGFSDNDLSHLQSINATGIQLGPRILRTETAGLAVIAILQAQLGDI